MKLAIPKAPAAKQGAKLVPAAKQAKPKPATGATQVVWWMGKKDLR